ncbi:MAG: DUF4259 domain-containing protein [Alphaproteobacteria bacterium]|jgi:hypothetical protein
MGSWGTSPWDNDGAADWFGDLFDATGFAEHLRDALEGDAVEDLEEIRAAASLLILLGRTYVYPIDCLDEHLALAVTKLRQLAEPYRELGDEESAARVECEIALLEARLDRHRREPPPHWEDMW